MSSPFSTPVPDKPISDRQISFLTDLTRKYMTLNGYTNEDIEDALTATGNKHIAGLSRQEASEAIDKKLDQIKKLEKELVENPAVTAEEDRIDGFWELPDGRIVKVQYAVHGSGRPYGKVLDTVSGGFNYLNGIVNNVRREGTRLTLERAQELGHLYGMCIRCGATLTDEASIAAGIGPVCATKF